MFCYFFFFKQRTADELRISDWSSDVCFSDLTGLLDHAQALLVMQEEAAPARPPLGVALPGRDAPGPGQLVHALEVARLVRVDATMDEQPRGSRHLVDEDRKRVV